MFFGERYLCHGIPGSNYEKVRKDWMDDYLKGECNSTPHLRSVISQSANSDKARTEGLRDPRSITSSRRATTSA